MNTVQLRAPAKINLGLDVVKRLENGYHQVHMIMQTVGLFDTLTVTATEKPGITLTTNREDLPINEDNLVYKAAQLLLAKYPQQQGLSIHLEKNIPIAAGLAGGSSDAAACLKAVNEIFSLGLSREQLMDDGKTLGADIPYCILGGTAISQGIGEILTPLPPAPATYVLLVKPNASISTKYVYEHLNLTEDTHHPDISLLLKDLEEKNMPQFATHMENILETVTLPICREISIIKETLAQSPTMGALMSGSGPTVFGLFHTREEAEEGETLCQKLPFPVFTYVTEFVNHLTEVSL